MVRLYVKPCEKCGEEDPSIQYDKWPSKDGTQWFYFRATCNRCTYKWLTDGDTPPEPMTFGLMEEDLRKTEGRW